MEPHKNLSGIESWRPPTNQGVHAYFGAALAFAEEFYSSEMKKTASVKFEEITSDQFFSEYTWVVHATGFSAKAVGKFMPRLLVAYGDWNSLGRENFEDSFKRVQLVCNNRQKAAAIHKTAQNMVVFFATGRSWEDFKKTKMSSHELLQQFSYIGKITCFHLARNIGLLESVKPDLHLIRLANLWGFDTCENMCKAVRPEGMPLGIVDLVLWYSASHYGTIDIRKPGDR